MNRRAGEPLAQFHDRFAAGSRDKGHPAVRHAQPHQLRRRRPKTMHRGRPSASQREALRQTARQEGTQVYNFYHRIRILGILRIFKIREFLRLLKDGTNFIFVYTLSFDT